MNCCPCGQSSGNLKTDEAPQPGSASPLRPFSSDCLPVRRSVREIVSWLIPGLVVAFMPKCPACVAAYVAVGTGIGLSFSTAAALRRVLLLIACCALGFLAVRFLLRRRPLTET